MKLTIFGATGPSGRLTTQRALAEGHEVTVYARNPGKLAIEHERLTVIRGELGETAAIAAAIAGREAVISLLGQTTKSVGRPLTEGLTAIVAGMEAGGVRRLIAIATPSARDPHDRPASSFAFAVTMVRTLLPKVYADIVGSAEVVRASGLDWTLVRVPMLDGKVGTPPAHAGYVGAPGVRLFSLSRNVLADFLIAQLTDAAWIGKAPVVCNRT